MTFFKKELYLQHKDNYEIRNSYAQTLMTTRSK